MAEITYICKRTVVSTKPTQPGKYHSFSVLDHLMEKNHIRIVYYCKSWGEKEAGEITVSLRESISEMLTHFPKVTGRLIRNEKGNWMIKCNDAGVRMVEARAKGSVEDWLKIVDREKELKLVYWEDMIHKPYFWSTFYVQAWADKTLGQKMVSPPFFHPLPPRRPINKTSNHKPYADLINHYKFSIENSIPLLDANHTHTTITLSFSDHMVQACMDMVQPTSAPNKPNRPSSPFEALAGLLWICISKVKGLRNGLVNMSLCLDQRKVLGLDKGFFGNCMVCNKVHSNGLEEHNLSQATKVIGEALEKMDNEGIMDLIEWLKHNDSYSHPLMNNCDLICASLETAEPYSVDFVGGFEPIRVSYYVEPTIGIGQVLIFRAPSYDGPLGRVVMVTLPKDEIVKLCEDELILHLSPRILMGVARNHA
ncbi:spermidine hydroxycinnamoyl transferase [Quercus suber]|uniref:Spermidine hydroxycinnamoyl transferase n=1 Tax=Quercus suber TaxID=58331 RepID=A0AAW0LNC3_QUESU